MSDTEQAQDPRKTGTTGKVFRWKDTPDIDFDSIPLFEGEDMGYFPRDEVTQARVGKMIDAGMHEGLRVKALVDAPGFNIVYGRAKPGWMVPLHFHKGPAVYFVVRGSATYGNVELEAGDSIYLPAGTPYVLTAGDEGAEIMEIRSASFASTNFVGSKDAYWDKCATKLQAAKDKWSDVWPTEYGAPLK